MFKNKLIAAGILSISTLALSVPAMASGWAYTDSNYAGRYSCHTYVGQANYSAAYVVSPNGWGSYTAGELYLNVQSNDAPCVFTLETYGTFASSYWVDSKFGVAYETLNWFDYNDDACAGTGFEDDVQGSLVANANSSNPASQTLTTDNNLDVNYSFAGSGNCVLGGAVNSDPYESTVK
ncbi:MAG: hypothetical protein ABSG46_07080 [Candidatus Binataceae bacterium]